MLSTSKARPGCAIMALFEGYSCFSVRKTIVSGSVISARSQVYVLSCGEKNILVGV